MNNSIELRNDSAGSDYFLCSTRVAAEQQAAKDILEPGDSETWTSRKDTFNGKRMNESVLWTIEAEYSDSDGVTPETEHTILRDRNIPPSGSLDLRLSTGCTRETIGCQVSHEFGNHEKDWDFLVRKANEILAGNNLTDSSSQWDKAMAMATHVQEIRGWTATKDGYVSNGANIHPVDYFYRGGYCTGSANTMVGLCSVLGIPGRGVYFFGHAMCEVCIDGKWCFVENAPQILSVIPDGCEKGPLFTYSILDALSDPVKVGFTKRDAFVNKIGSFSTADGPRYLHYSLESYSGWLFNLENEYYNGQPKCLVNMTPNSAYEISVLYPNQSVPYKCKKSPVMNLTPYNTGWIRGRNHKIYSGIRQDFYLSHFDNLKQVRSCILLDKNVRSGTKEHSKHNMPEDGGNWYYSLNGNKTFLCDVGGWQIKEGYGGTDKDYLFFDIPLEQLARS